MEQKAGHLWSKALKNTLISLGWTQCKSDTCVYVKDENILAVYVDDLTIVSRNEKAWKEDKEKIKMAYKCKDLGEAKWLLGMAIKQSEHAIEITQTAYIEQTLEEFNMKDCKPTKLPMATGHDL